MKRREFLKKGCSLLPLAAGAIGLSGCLGTTGPASGKDRGERPNFIVIFCDDLGYGDIGCFGSTKHRTPNVDKMAREGIKFTSFYVTSGVCTPSRSSLMTGCYPRRVNMHNNWDKRWVLFPVDKKGLNPEEITVAEVLKKQGYATACVGKWHLGDQKQFLPTRQGFDQYFGIPYSNDMGIRPNSPKNPPLPLLRGEDVIEAPVDQTTITKRYTEEVIGFIRKNRDRPFFVYLPHTMPHNPVNSSEAFKGKSANKGYGDCVEEIDWSTGEILRTLKELGIDRDTLVIFTSDNGAASRWGGSNLPLSGFKGSTMDGGMRVPCVMRWPGRIPAGISCDELASTIDIMPTFANLAGGDAPKDRIIDGRDIYPLMAGRAGAKSPHEAFYFYYSSQLQAVRSGKWKLHLPTEEVKIGTKTVRKREMKLYDLSADIGESNDLSKKEPKVVKRLMRLADKARADIGDAGMEGANQRAAGWDDDPVALTKGK